MTPRASADLQAHLYGRLTRTEASLQKDSGDLQPHPRLGREFPRRTPESTSRDFGALVVLIMRSIPPSPESRKQWRYDV